jgi:hypothetical protein
VTSWVRSRRKPGGGPQPGHHATTKHRGIRSVVGGNGGPFPAWRTVPLPAGRPDPGDLQPGAGTIVGGETANEAIEAALASYPGGIVDRVVKLTNGEYEVHNIGVNWPHHIFVNQDLKVIEAD